MRGLEQIPWLYDSLMRISDRFGLIRWRRRLISWSKGRVLEVGCGTGRNLELYACDSLVGCDPFLGVVVAARRKQHDAHLLVASAEALPFRADSFDSVVSSLVFCSVPDPRLGLSEVERVLDDDGRLLMMEHVRHHRPWRARIQDWIHPAWKCLSGGCNINRDTESTVRASGFEIEAETRRSRGTMRLFVARPRR